MSHADTVNTWFRQRLSSGPIARDTEAYNQLTSALPQLIEALDAAAPAPIASASKDAPSEEPPQDADADPGDAHHEA